MRAFKKALAERPVEVVHQIQRINVTIDEQINFILNRVSGGRELSFIELVRNVREKIRIIVTFIAMLELIKMGQIGLKETFNFNDFVIYGIDNNG
jgi:segregation and condensation protein A